MTDLVPVRRALISLSDKTGLEELAAGLARHGVEIVSTGGTAAKLRELGVDVRDISDLTGFPEMMDGRVKTLHPKVHGGLLAVRDTTLPGYLEALDDQAFRLASAVNTAHAAGYDLDGNAGQALFTFSTAPQGSS